jgi:hypothetical protein
LKDRIGDNCKDEEERIFTKCEEYEVIMDSRELLLKSLVALFLGDEDLEK